MRRPNSQWALKFWASVSYITQTGYEFGLKLID